MNGKNIFISLKDGPAFAEATKSKQVKNKRGKSSSWPFPDSSFYWNDGELLAVLEGKQVDVEGF